ncbi:MAG TPA: helix-turn-helix domain-containing protein [Microlunatus sp.]
MIEHHYTDPRIPGSRRLATFDACQQNEPLAAHVSSTRADDFRTRLRVVDLSSLDVVALQASSCRVDHTPALVTESDPQLCAVVLTIDGGLELQQDGRETLLGPDQLGLYTSSTPFRLDISPGHPTTSLLRVQLPKSRLAIPDHAVDGLTAVPITSRYGFGALLKDFLFRLTGDSSEFRTDDLYRLAELVADLITALLAQQRGRDGGADCVDVARTALLQRIDDHVHDHLSDPELSPRSIAAAQHISIGHLHRLFTDRGYTIAAWIRRLRLERTRQDLQDPAQDLVPIHRIATHWGFADHSTFTRAFRREYGMTPQEARFERSGRPTPRTAQSVLVDGSPSTAATSRGTS